MSEYDKKIQEIKDLCKWAHDHQREIIEHGDGIVLAAVYGKPQRITNMVIGRGGLVRDILLHLADGAVNSQENIESIDTTGGVQ